MRTFFSSVILTLFALFLAMPGKAMAAGDTLVVFASSEQSLDEVIGGDVDANGMQNHKVYKLVSTDTTYLYTAAMTIKSDIEVLGVQGPDGRPACIQPGILGDGSMPAELFNLNGTGMTAKFQNIYFFGLSISGTFNWGKTIYLQADSIRLYVDRCIFEENRGQTIPYTGMYPKIYITNSVFRNGVLATDWFSTTVTRRGWPTSNPADSIVFRNNTIFCINGYAAAYGTNQYSNYFEFTHNNVVYNFVEPFIIFSVTDVKINDNIFYGTFAGAEPNKEYPWWHETFSPEIGSIISIDTLTASMDSSYDPANIGNPNARMLAEQKRTFELKNNVWFQPQALTDFWAEWNTTHTGPDSLITPVWMNNRTKNMFTDKTNWPGYVESGNQNIDPQFGSDLKAVVDQPGTMEGTVSLIDYVAGIRGNTATTKIWGYKNQDVLSSGNWVPQWPLPETEDMKYANEALKTAATDGLPVGDLNWFKGTVSVDDDAVQSPAKFALYEAYPNPFNPSTNIKFSLAKAGNFSIKVYNVTGELVKVLADNVYKEAGEYQYTLNMNNLSSGVYFYTLVQGGQQLTKKLVLMK